MSSKRQDSLAFPLCRFSFADGRRCAQPAHPQSNGLCYTHAHTPLRRLRPSDLSRELIAPPGAIVPPEKIQRLAKIPLALAQGLLTPKEAAVLAHLCNLLIHSSRVARGASHPAANPDPDWAFVSALLDDDDDEYDSAAFPPYLFLG